MAHLSDGHLWFEGTIPVEGKLDIYNSDRDICCRVPVDLAAIIVKAHNEAIFAIEADAYTYIERREQHLAASNATPRTTIGT